MPALHEYIRTASPEYLTFDGVEEALTDAGFRDGFSQEAALWHARRYLPFFTEAVNDKILLVGTFPQMQFADRRNEQLPAINWGVCGASYAAGTLAAMNALRLEADKAGFESEVATPKKLDDRAYDLITRAWFRFTVTGQQNPAEV